MSNYFIIRKIFDQICYILCSIFLVYLLIIFILSKPDTNLELEKTAKSDTKNFIREGKIILYYSIQWRLVTLWSSGAVFLTKEVY